VPPYRGDENGRINPISIFVSIFFFVKTGLGSANACLKIESGYADARKRINTDEEPEN
jgi:hypothetical protein